MILQKMRHAYVWAVSFLFVANAAHAATVSLAGGNADGYLAIAGYNQEFGAGLNPVDDTASGISADPNDPKFFDYPAYVNPAAPAAIYVMAVQPYQFGLSYPDPLHPTGPGVYSSVGTLQPRNADGTIPTGATFVEAFTEDADFDLTDIGQIDFDDALVTGVGVEVVGVANLTLSLDGSEFDASNRTQLNAADIGPFAPDGRSNRNEFSNAVTLTASNLAGTGLTYVDGVLTSIDFTADVHVSALADALAPFVGMFGLDTADFDADGTLTFSGNQFAFDVDGQDGNLVAQNVRVLLNRSGAIDAVTPAVPEPAAMLLGAIGATVAHAFSRRR